VTQGVVSSNTPLLQKACTVVIGQPLVPGQGVSITNQSIGLPSALDVWFSVKRNLKAKTPNACDLRLYNMTAATRASITQVSALSPTPTINVPAKTLVPVSLTAGYANATSVIFSGFMRSAQVTSDNPDYVVEIQAGDGDGAIVYSRSTASFQTGTTAYTVAVQLMMDMGCTPPYGNLATVAAALRASKLYSGGYVLKGNSMEHLYDLANSCGLEVTIQGGVPQWTMRGQALGGQAYVLSSTSGLLGSPSMDSKGLLSFETELLPGLGPGSPIQMNSLFIKGLFRITSVEITGDTNAPVWGIKGQAKPVGLAA